MKKTNVESFEFDHRKVTAPYIREVVVYENEDYGVVSKYDIRVCQPNEDFLEPGIIHSMEHLLADKIRDIIEGVIDLSPMGCLTGFYLTVFGKRDLEEIKAKIVESFKAASEVEEVPAMNEIQCGNYRLHQPKLAKVKLEEFVSKMK
ncbi:S-ribosylhomocysteine lyase [Orenia marismortui]|uniref:S-ribosylhomocysteine lyase n=1 Tax=Orenia marismortui TaxID=46469 RepID=A0A4R8H0M0_9FIRM|nr:S-ribosylhomocysteine lyase [Orenia marismortui]TDX52972.1 S-ribosylhomocysteine lyase /quorum-sensing autoinducer 2 (AI-2) synthesis protein LuxS [Orenia marismortui]